MNLEAIQQDCWDKALYSFGTGYIFERRAETMRNRLRWLNFAGIALPLIVGVTATVFSNLQWFPVVITVAGVLGGIQIVFSLWSLTAGWNENFAYSTRSLSTNKELSEKFKLLASNPPASKVEMQLKYELLLNEYKTQSKEDEIQGLSDKERRMGMRAGLIAFNRSCVRCELVPTSMEPSDCNTCGNF